LIIWLVVGIALGSFVVRYSYDEVHPKWRLIYSALQIAFCVLVVLGAYYHTGPKAEASFAGLIVIGGLLISVFRLGNGKTGTER
jgi:uncharacterized membrane protein YoaK (UPF0700 family)